MTRARNGLPRRLSTVLAVPLLSLAALSMSAPPTDFKGKRPPELVTSEKGWLQWKEPITLMQLRGHVVWLEFGFIECGSCVMMEPMLAKWDRAYRSKGFVVLKVDHGEMDDFDRLTRYVERKKTTYPVLWDEKGKNATAYGVRMYPRALLIGVDGKVLWEGMPADVDFETWKLLDSAMEEHKKRIGDALEAVDLVALREAKDPFLASAKALEKLGAGRAGSQ